MKEEVLPTNELLIEKHIEYVQSLDQQKNTLSYHLTEHLRMNGIYWGLTVLHLLQKPEGLPKQEMIDWVMSCWDVHQGGFGPHPGHDPHLHSTLSAIQILVMQDSLEILNREKVIEYVLARFKHQNGTFEGDCWGETDNRFTYCAIATLSLLNALENLDQPLIAKALASCQNFDGGFGMIEGAESHAAYVWTAIAGLAILGRLELIQIDRLGWWLSERQLANGGLNGRPEKLEDVCYVRMIEREKLARILVFAVEPTLNALLVLVARKRGASEPPEHLFEWSTTEFEL
ncbi:hypothetical protein CROQUDRAFT_724847 [Cronartium quercuum f. sp. fusiforme G11]|uniref:Geranylgeranyl transferase type-2 subunit beta n=1 Tax=Cronartium quercuum f. sp. fusiforme G11 TaxID=708437 RepID=A0A9P6NFW3_9BASI|nr:hypothetical protein CROQUDRAFT_724847 [Cronartium quercuum f. sp. fusiforme G11]